MVSPIGSASRTASEPGSFGGTMSFTSVRLATDCSDEFDRDNAGCGHRHRQLTSGRNSAHVTTALNEDLDDLGSRRKLKAARRNLLNTKNMTTRTIYITAADMKRLRPLVETLKNSRDDLKSLRQELELARVVAPDEVPPDVVTMNSKARVREVASGEEMTYTLVFPEQADVEQGRISVVAPIGTAMLGQRVGDEFEWQVPAGPVRIRVEEVLYQPEAAGHFHL
jgi:regulator of nucleoside diphosphate kinase